MSHNSQATAATALPLDRLQELLRKQQQQQHQQQQQQEDEAKDEAQSCSPSLMTRPSLSQAGIRQFYHANGLMIATRSAGAGVGRRDHAALLWERPIPSDVYKCPLSQHSTTLVDWDSLPRSIQDLYGAQKPEGGILEIDRVHLLAYDSGAGGAGGAMGTTSATAPTAAATAAISGGVGSTSETTNTLHRRPLTGNMTNKLTEYTRGVSGQCRPFRPGGISEEDEGVNNKKSGGGGGNNHGDEENESTSNPYLTPQAIADSLKPLTQGCEASWKDGTLLTAPPGVDFTVGLSYEDIYGKTHDDDNIIKEEEEEEIEGPMEKEDENWQSLDAVTANAPSSSRLTPAIQWDQNFLDDDSLFGSEEESSDSDDDDENSADDDDGDEDKETNDGDEDEVAGDHKNGEGGEDNAADAPLSSATTPAAQPSDLDEITGSDHDIDQLLKELSRAEARTKREMASKEDQDKDENNIHLNPLELAQRQAKLLTDSTRKTWATTALLPIDDFHSWIPNPAMTFPFTLDTFQQQAVARLERNESVFVAAHTSAGKTVVAEYACALAKQRGTRCVYTSPIKALSNQKFRDFSQKFGSENVGLITGDLQLNVDDSTCLIMTTEILRSMLYRGADLIRDIEWVIFDEVHYVNDSERGVVWEEVIIMLPSYVNLIFLSATTPNTLDFSDWIGRTKRKPVHVVKTDYRPVPLSHHLWANLKLHKVMEGKSGFYDKGYQEASNALKPKSANNNKGKGSAGGGAKGSKPSNTSSARGAPEQAWRVEGSKADWMSLVRFLEREELTPTVVFSFSKKKCEEIANMLRSLDLNTGAEAGTVQGFTLQTVARLSPNDAVLPQVLTVCEMVKRGIGVHHGGLLPILKEMVEILFSRNLIKILFATETFAMGVNMPARAVVFNSIRKHDGTQFRVLEPGEYTQMAGRAGRRGLDKVGTVIMCCFGETPPPIGMIRNMLTGSSTMLRSQFRLTYNMILNLLRVEEMSVESMIKRSFSEFATQRALTANDYPKLLARGRKTLIKLEDQLKNEAHQRVGAEDLEEYFSVCTELITTNRSLLQFIITSADDSADTVFQAGRILLISSARKLGVVRTPGIILENRASQAPASASSGTQGIGSLVCMVLLPESYVPEAEFQQPGEPKAVAIGSIGFAKNRYYAIYEATVDQLILVTSSKKKLEPNLLFKDSKATKSTTGRALASSAFFGAKPASRGFDDPFAGMKARGGRQNEDEAFFGKKTKKSGISSEAEAIESTMDLLVAAEREEMSTGLQPLDMRDCVKRGNDLVDFIKECGFVEILADRMRQYQSHRHPTLEKYYTLVERKHQLKERVDALNHLLSNESLQLFPDFLQRKAVLRTLGYLDEHETVSVKGRVACEVNSCEELIVTEMVFEGILNELEPTEIVAALSALLYQQKSEENFDMEVPESLLTCCDRMKTIALNLGQLQREHGLDVDPLEYAESTLKFGLVHVVYEWALGVPFSNICELTDAQEGSIVRCITRLDELCREVRNCARVVGNPTLYRKMEAASVAIKRDIVFAASLYVS